MKFTVLCTLLLTLVCAQKVLSQSRNPPEKNGTPNNTDTTQTGSLNTAVVDTAVDNANTGTSLPTNDQPALGNGKPNPKQNRRKNRRRRPRKRPNNNKKPANAATFKANKPPQEQPNNQPQERPLNQALTKAAPEKKSNPPTQSKPIDNQMFNPSAVKDANSFFAMFPDEDVTTTTIAPTQGIPPDFDPNKPANKKIMPKVDVENSTAHDGTPCSRTYKPHETIKTKYMMQYAEGVWETLDCPPNLGSGLIWRQDLCSCGEEIVAHDPDDHCGMMGFSPNKDNRHKYMRRHHGIDAVMDCAASLVWSQKNCLCIFDPIAAARPIENIVGFACKTILHLKFEGDLKNSAEGYNVKPVKLDGRGKLPRIRYIKTAGSIERAAMFVSQPLEFQAYRGNDFQKQVTYSLNFKISPRHENRNNFMVLLTDECLGFQAGQTKDRKPSISLTFQPSTSSFRLRFRTDMSEVDQIIKGAQKDKNGWYKTVVYFEDGTVNLENNGKKLFSVSDIAGKIPQNKCNLYIAGRGRGYDRTEDFYGYMDNIFLVKDCKFHEANIKFL